MDQILAEVPRRRLESDEQEALHTSVSVKIMLFDWNPTFVYRIFMSIPHHLPLPFQWAIKNVCGSIGSDLTKFSFQNFSNCTLSTTFTAGARRWLCTPASRRTLSSCPLPSLSPGAWLARSRSTGCSRSCLWEEVRDEGCRGERDWKCKRLMVRFWWGPAPFHPSLSPRAFSWDLSVHLPQWVSTVGSSSCCY